MASKGGAPMWRSIVGALGFASLLVAPPLASALTLEDCELWLQQLQGETSGVHVSGTDGTSEHDALIKDLKSASLGREGTKTSQSLKDVESFRKRAAKLTAEGKLSAMEGERLDTLSDTVRHCIEQAQ